MTEIITIAGQKGGTGKSITAVNLAASLALLEHKTLLIDTDPQGCSTRWSGVKPANGMPDLASIFTGRSQMIDAVTATCLKYMDVIPSSLDLLPAELKISRHPGNEKILRVFLKDIQGEYDYIIIDSPSSYSFFAIMALMAADNLLPVMTCGKESFESLASLLEIMKYIRQVHDISLKISGLLINRCQTMQQAGAFSKALNFPDADQTMGGIFIPEDDTVRQSIEKGSPCALMDIKSPVAQAYLNFASHMHCFFNK